MASSARESFPLNIPPGKEGRKDANVKIWVIPLPGGQELRFAIPSPNELSGQYSWKVNQWAGTKYLEQKYPTLDWGPAWRPQRQKHPALCTLLLQPSHRLCPGCSQPASESREWDKPSTFLLLRAWAAGRQPEGRPVTAWQTEPVAVTGDPGPCRLPGQDWAGPAGWTGPHQSLFGAGIWGPCSLWFRVLLWCLLSVVTSLQWHTPHTLTMQTKLLLWCPALTFPFFVLLCPPLLAGLPVMSCRAGL